MFGKAFHLTGFTFECASDYNNLLFIGRICLMGYLSIPIGSYASKVFLSFSTLCISLISVLCCCETIIQPFINQLMAEERGLSVDVEGFNVAMDEARERSRSAQNKVVYHTFSCGSYLCLPGTSHASIIRLN